MLTSILNNIKMKQMQTKNEKYFFNGMQTDGKPNFGPKKKSF